MVIEILEHFFLPLVFCNFRSIPTFLLCSPLPLLFTKQGHLQKFICPKHTSLAHTELQNSLLITPAITSTQINSNIHFQPCLQYTLLEYRNSTSNSTSKKHADLFPPQADSPLNFTTCVNLFPHQSIKCKPVIFPYIFSQVCIFHFFFE